MDRYSRERGNSVFGRVDRGRYERYNPPEIAVEKKRLENKKLEAETSALLANTDAFNAQAKTSAFDLEQRQAEANRAWRGGFSLAGNSSAGGGNVGEMARKGLASMFDPNATPASSPLLAKTRPMQRLGEGSLFGGNTLDTGGMMGKQERPDLRVRNDGFNTIQDLRSSNKGAMDQIYRERIADAYPESGSGVGYWRDKATGKMRMMSVEPSYKYEAERGMSEDERRAARPALDQQAESYKAAQSSAEAARRHELDKETRQGIASATRAEILRLDKEIADYEEQFATGGLDVGGMGALTKKLDAVRARRQSLVDELIGKQPEQKGGETSGKRQFDKKDLEAKANEGSDTKTDRASSGTKKATDESVRYEIDKNGNVYSVQPGMGAGGGDIRRIAMRNPRSRGEESTGVVLNDFGYSPDKSVLPDRYSKAYERDVKSYDEFIRSLPASKTTYVPGRSYRDYRPINEDSKQKPNAGKKARNEMSRKNTGYDGNILGAAYRALEENKKFRERYR